MPERLDRVATRFLTRRYLFALAIVAALTVAALAVIQHHLSRQRHDAAVINLAGRQRMLSQELVKAELARRYASQSGDAVQAEARGAEATRVLDEWTGAHARLTGDVGLTGVGIDNSAAVASAFADLEPSFARMRSAALASDDGAIARLLTVERDYLGRMNAIVGLYQEEAAARVNATMRLELWLCGVVLAALLVEALFVFRPAVRWLRAAIGDQERLREQEAINRELTVATDVARGIGYDLHDGVGQALTALTLQAKLVERAVPEAIAPRIAALREGIAEALAQTRAAAACLAPIDVRVDGLPTALKRLADATSLAAGIDCRADCSADLLPDSGDDLYRIAQEAVANAMRHGRARSIVISLHCEHNAGVLAVQDDGAGGAVESPVTAATSVPVGGNIDSGANGADGVGMRSMRHRAERIGGSLSAGARREGGWRVECRFPLARSVAG